MGRLDRKVIVKFVMNWGAPLLVAGLVLVFADSRISANPEPGRDQLQSYINDKKISVGSESINGYQQIYYMFDNVQVFITDTPRNHTDPVVSGQYVAWSESVDSFPQIYMYDLLEKTSIKVTQTGTNLFPSISENRVVWEGEYEGVKQIFYFDGIEFKQLSSGYLSIRASIKDNIVIYAQHLGDTGNNWRVLSQDVNTDDPPTIVSEGTELDAWPRFEGNDIKTRTTSEREPSEVSQ